MSASRTARAVIIVGSVALALAAPPSVSAKSPVNTTLFGHEAVKGYDVVAYFTEGKPVEGRDEFTVDWMGASWRFATAQHRDLFKAAPERYAPQYGGYCAYAVANGRLVDIDPRAFTIVNGKLYLNYSFDVQKKWSQDVAGYVRKADSNWPDLAK